MAPTGAAPAAPAKGKKPDPKAAKDVPVEPVAAAGDSSEVVMQKLMSLWKEVEFISIEDPFHAVADMDTLKTMKPRVTNALAEATSVDGADLTLFSYSKGGVGGLDGCLLQGRS